MKKLKIAGIVLVLFILYVIIGMLVPFVHMKSVSKTNKSKIHTETFYSTSNENGSDRAKIVSDNQEALDLRLDMIRKAKKEIILSTFDIREGSSSDDIFSELLKASRRGVKIKILVDGLYGTIHMTGKDIFAAVGSEPNVEIRFYNTPNLLKPWTINGCLHDKYIVADHKYLLMGGRNMFDYFLGTHKGKSKGIDREILIVNQGSKDQGAVGQIRRYFQKVWNLEVCKTKFSTCSKNKKEKEVKRLLSHAEKVKVPDYDYQKITVPTKKTTLVTNPTTIYGKEPVVFETLKQLMLQAKSKVIIHTPYAVFSKEMYEGIAQVKQQVPNTTMILNSIASGDNICASADYQKNRSKILGTGVSLYEYMGRHSTHGKSLIIDDDIAVVGSYNFDCRSTYVDTETMIVVQGKEITKQLEEDFSRLKSGSLKVNKDGSYQNDKNVAERTMDSKKQGMIKILSYIIQAFRYLA